MDNPERMPGRIVFALLVVAGLLLAGLSLLSRCASRANDDGVGRSSAPAVVVPVRLSAAEHRTEIADTRAAVAAPTTALEGEGPPPDAALDALVRRLEALIAAQVRDPAPYEEVLTALLALGDPAATEVVVATMCRPDVAFDREAHVFARVLRDVDHPDVPACSRRALERVLAAGEVSIPELSGYAELLIARGGEAGELVVATYAERLASERSSATYAVASTVAHMTSDAAIRRMSALVGTGDNGALDRAIVDGLVRAASATVNEELYTIAFRAGVDEEIRRDAYRNLGERVAPSEVPALIAAAAAVDARDRIIVLKGVVGLTSNRDVERPLLWDNARQFLAECLHSDDPRLAASTRRSLLDLPSDPSGAFLQELRAAERAATDPRIADELRKAIALYPSAK